MSEDKLFDDMIERDLFLVAVAEGIPEINAGLEVGWTPHQTLRNLADADFAALVELSKTQADGIIEKILFDQAKKGNMSAIQMWLYNRQSSKWKDVKRIEVNQTHKIEVGVVG